MLSVKQLSKHYGDKQALKDVSFDVKAGEVVALLGANGSGKTTTINSICNLIEFDQGDILFDGISVLSDKRYLAQIGAVLGGSRNINWRLTTKQNAEYFAALKGHSGKALKQNINSLEHQLGLKEYERLEVLKLSTGNKQKAALLCALAYSPKLLLLDEPTLGLDFKTVDDLQKIILTQAKEHGQSYVITSHDMSFIEKMCQKVVVIEQGQTIFSGSVEQLKHNLYGYRLCFSITPNLLSKMQSAIKEHCLNNYKISYDQNMMTIDYESPHQVLPLLSWLHTSSTPPDDLTMTKLSMQEAYQSLTTKGTQK